MKKICVSQPALTRKQIEAVVAVLESGQLVEGPVVSRLEQSLADYCEAKGVVAMNSGTAALHGALYAAGIKPGDEVITTPFSFVATANPILFMGAKVVFADINPLDYNLDPKAVEKKITKKTKAIIGVDLYGQPINYKNLRFDRSITLIEDACQAIGSSLKGKKAGTLADIGAFSFYATKNIMCGEGGAMVTNNPEFDLRARRFRNHGQDVSKRYQYVDVGYNYRLTDILAAILLPQIKEIDKITQARQVRAQRYQKNLGQLTSIGLPRLNRDTIHSFHQFTITLQDSFPVSREKLISILNERNIFPGTYYPTPLHLQPQFKKFGYRLGDFPVTERLSQKVLSLPVHPKITLAEIDYVSEVLLEVAKIK